MRSKKLICLVLSIIFIVSSVAVSFVVFANDSGNGYEYSALTKTLEILSDDAMIDKDEESYTENPWNSYRNSIENIIIDDGVTKISAYAFCRMDSLINVKIADSVEAIGDGAFDSNKIVCSCSVSSYAQKWCLQNYIAFDTPISTGTSEAIISNAGDKLYWSITPLTDCAISYSADGKYDTVGYIYDADTYVYSTKELTMRKSAIEYNDDKSDEELNFSITTELKAGKRYYLSTALKSTTKTGSYSIQLNQICTSHIYKISSVERNGLTKAKINAKCIGCNNTTSTDFETAVKEKIEYCDVNNDGKVNAKDYAMIIHEQF